MKTNDVVETNIYLMKSEDEGGMGSLIPKLGFKQVYQFEPDDKLSSEVLAYLDTCTGEIKYFAEDVFSEVPEDIKENFAHAYFSLFKEKGKVTITSVLHRQEETEPNSDGIIMAEYRGRRPFEKSILASPRAKAVVKQSIDTYNERE
jgi:hypothetical protein